MPERADFNRRVERVRDVLGPDTPPVENETSDSGPSEDAVREVQQEGARGGTAGGARGVQQEPEE
jgi:hypothetical protein